MPKETKENANEALLDVGKKAFDDNNLWGN